MARQTVDRVPKTIPLHNARAVQNRMGAKILRAEQPFGGNFRHAGGPACYSYWVFA
jgi:hypothetical protein